MSFPRAGHHRHQDIARVSAVVVIGRYVDADLDDDVWNDS